ncbi:MAG: heme lyase CcmF/NrfE family subunit [Pseudomonadota bacterium]
MTAELGHISLILALFAALTQATLPMVGAARGWSDWMRLATPAAVVQCTLVAVAFAALTRAFILSDFSLAVVAANSHSAKPLLYKVTGVWGNHEGSMLLWVLILALFGAMVAVWGRNLPPGLKARVLGVQAWIGVAFLAFLLFTSNPFSRLAVPPLDGGDLNPLLQDPGLALHPPFLYLGYVGLSIVFSFAIAALLEGRVDAAWARWVRPWTLAAWLFLTVGIALGSWWAYYELGWGGWWFWDPVENASFMPWLVAAALLHSAIVVEKREALKSWTILLAILAFSFSLLGTFIVRSGVLTSVHAFANDPERGIFILAIFAIFTGGGLTLFAARSAAMQSGAAFASVSRESALIANNLLLLVSAAVVLIGTMWPLVIELATDGATKLSVGPPFFDMAFTPFIVMLAMILPLGAVLPWKRAKLGRAMRPLWGAAALSVALGALVWSLNTGGRMLGPIGTVLAAWLVLGAVAELGARARAGSVPLGETLRRLAHLPRADWGKAVAHAGLGLLIFGIAMITAFETEDIRSARPGDVIEIGGATLEFVRVEQVAGPNYEAERGVFLMREDGGAALTLTPERRFYPVQRMTTTEASIDYGLTRDIYVSLGERQRDGGWAVRSYHKPFATWLWIGSLVMSLGAALSLTDRRYRVGAAGRKTQAAPPDAVPAE